MRKLRLVFLCVLTLIATLFIFSLFASTAEAATTVYTANVTSKTYGASGSDKKDDTSAIQKALNLARGSKKYTSSKPLTVYIPKGTYYISKTLYIYSYTTLKLNAEAKIVMSKANVYYMIRNAHVHTDSTMHTGSSNDAKTCTSSKCGGYKQGNYIKIYGGIWYQSKKSTTATAIVSIRHAQNISLYAMTVYYASEHFFNLSATKNTYVTNVKFYSSRTYSSRTNYSAIEAVHLDTAWPDGSTSGEPYLYPRDKTPCVNVKISGCTFKNVHAGVGNHHTNSGKYGSNITVKNCTFSNLEGRAVNLSAFVGCTITNNTATKVESFLYIDSSSEVTADSNKVTSTTGSFVKAYDSDTIVISNSTFSKGVTANGTNKHGFYLVNCAGVEVSKNTISSVPGIGIYLNEGGSISIAGNTISSCGTYGIRLAGVSAMVPAVASVTNNTFSKNTKGDIQVGNYTCNSVFSGNGGASISGKTSTGSLGNTYSE